jgi:hypothetical protein
MTPRRSPRARAYAPDPAAPGRRCDHPGCLRDGEYRAPKSRQSLNEYHWFCLEHVRAYNASWDYYKGMTPGQIEAETRADTGWQRPTWPLGAGGRATFDETTLRDPLQLLATARERRGPDQPQVPAEMREPIRTLGLTWPVSKDVLKSRYKELAKLHHPDHNGGDASAEERLKTINLAYAAVRTYLNEAPRMARAG